MALYLGNEKYNVNQYADGFEDGEKSAIAQEWEGIQDGGARTSYAYAFQHRKIIKKNFKPIYDIRPKNASYFTLSTTVDEPIDMVELENECGIVFDFSKSTDMYGAFASNVFSRLNVIDLSSITSSYSTHYMCYGNYKGTNLTRIERLIFPKTVGFETTSFQTCNKLTYIGFEGELLGNITLSGCPLQVECLRTLLNCAKDLTGTGTTKTITLGKTNLAKLTDEEKAIATQKGWTLA